MSKTQTTQFAILGALSVFPMSGYDIKKWVSDVTGPFWSESSGQVYPTLASLLKEGLIKCKNQRAAGKKTKKVYSVTKKGLTVLKAWLKQPHTRPVMRDELSLKLFYGKNLTNKECLEHLERQVYNMKENLARFSSIKNHIKEEHKEDGNSFYWLLTLNAGVLHTKAELAWCEESIKQIKRIKK